MWKTETTETTDTTEIAEAIDTTEEAGYSEMDCS